MGKIRQVAILEGGHLWESRIDKQRQREGKGGAFAQKYLGLMRASSKWWGLVNNDRQGWKSTVRESRT